MGAIKIISGKKGWHLRVNGMYISHGFGPDVKAIRCDLGIPNGATEWVSVEAIRNFWNKYRKIVIESINRPYKSVWGRLEPIPIITETGGTWNFEKPVRSSLFKGPGKLTGRVEYHHMETEQDAMLEVDHGFGVDFIFESFLSQ